MVSRKVDEKWGNPVNITLDLLVDGNSVDIKQYCNDNYKFDFGNMRYSVGAGFTWITMIGPLSLSYAYPLNDKSGDNTKSIQFEIGRTF
jgi:outer membrane protein insertion porin family